MTLALAVGVGLFGGLGAIARFALDGAVSSRTRWAFPLGTLTVNLLGTLLLGVLTGAALSPDASRLTGTGFVGAFTTFSTWALESHRLAEDGQGRAAALNFAVSLALGLVAVAVGRAIGEAL